MRQRVFFKRIVYLPSLLRLCWPGDKSEVLRLTELHPFMRETATWLRQR